MWGCHTQRQCPRPIFNSQVLIKRNESVFEFYLNFKLKACKLQAFLTKKTQKKDKKTSSDINYILKPYI